MINSVYNCCDAIEEREVIALIALLSIEFGVILKSAATWNSVALLHNTVRELSQQRIVLAEQFAAA